MCSPSQSDSFRVYWALMKDKCRNIAYLRRTIFQSAWKKGERINRDTNSNSNRGYFGVVLMARDVKDGSWWKR